MDPDHVSSTDRCSVRPEEAFKKLDSSCELFGGNVKISLAISVQYPSFYVELINRLMGDIHDKIEGKELCFLNLEKISLARIYLVLSTIFLFRRAHFFSMSLRRVSEHFIYMIRTEKGTTAWVFGI